MFANWSMALRSDTDGDMNINIINIEDRMALSYGTSVCVQHWLVWFGTKKKQYLSLSLLLHDYSSTTALVHCLLWILQSMLSGILVKNLMTTLPAQWTRTDRKGAPYDEEQPRVVVSREWTTVSGHCHTTMTARRRRLETWRSRCRWCISSPTRYVLS